MQWLVVARERLEKQGAVMKALHMGLSHETSICVDDPPNPLDPFVACGQLWVVERIVPQAIRDRVPFWLVDNGYYRTSGLGRLNTGHFEMTYRGLVPILMSDPDYSRFPANEHLAPWRTHGKHVLIAMPGPTFGKMLGMNMGTWMDGIVDRVKQFTDRPIVVRHKNKYTQPIAKDLEGAHVLITHSSNAAIDAIVAGVPAIVARTNPAAPVCSNTLADIENPLMPDRAHWWASLMCQQYTLAEMANGTAGHFMKIIEAQVDATQLQPN